MNKVILDFCFNQNSIKEPMNFKEKSKIKKRVNTEDGIKITPWITI